MSDDARDRDKQRQTDGATFAVLLIQDAPGGPYADVLRRASVPTWTVRAGSDLDWLLRRASARPSLAVVDLRHITSQRSPRVITLAATVAATGLPTVLIGPDDNEAAIFGDVRVSLPAGAGPSDVLEAVLACMASRRNG